DNAAGYGPAALRLFNYLTGNGRPLLMVLVDRGRTLADLFPKPEAYVQAVKSGDVFLLQDELSEQELGRAASYLKKSGFWDLETDRLIALLVQDYGRSFFASFYSFVEPARPPLTEIARSLFVGLSETAKRLYLAVAALHQFGAEAPFELIRRALPMPAIE